MHEPINIEIRVASPGPDGARLTYRLLRFEDGKAFAESELDGRANPHLRRISKGAFAKVRKMVLTALTDCSEEAHIDVHGTHYYLGLSELGQVAELEAFGGAQRARLCAEIAKGIEQLWARGKRFAQHGAVAV